MTNANKTQSLVTLPKEVAEAIEALRFAEWADVEIVSIAEYIHPHGESRWATCEAGGGSRYVISKFMEHNRGNQLAFIRGVINGYQVEKSPEEKVREFYQGYIAEGYYSEAAAIRVAFIKYGITIPGVNAPAKEDK